MNQLSLSDYQASYDSPNFKVLLKYTLKQFFLSELEFETVNKEK